MWEQLSDVALIQIGLTKPTESNGSAFYWQSGDFDEFGRLLTSGPRLCINKDQQTLDRGWVYPGNVLLIGKGNRNTAIFYHDRYPLAVASATFYILRVNKSDVLLPEFLACYLNQPNTQAQIRSRVSSAMTVPTLNKKDLLDLPVPILPMATQQYLVSLHNTFLTIRDLNTQIITHHENLVIQCFSTIISGQTHPPKN